jgi:voltage-gated potassium channel
MLTGLAALFVLLVSATCLYAVEGPRQPDKFGSIPRALWWSVVTLTTIGYGDVYPATTLGKFLTGITAVVGVGLIATPAGILAAAFSDALQKQREAHAAAHQSEASE